MVLNNVPLSYIEQFEDDTSDHSLASRLYPEHLNGLNTMLIKGPWHDSFSQFILDNNIKALYLNFAHKWSCDDYSFLRNLKSIERLGILDAPSTGLEAIEEMDSLVDLSLNTYFKSKIDFTKLSKLKYCSLDWYKGTETILNATSLTHLYIDEFKTKDFSKLANLKNLEILAIKNSNIEDISCLSGLINLKKLELINCKKLTDFTPLTKLKTLEWLRIDGTKEVGNIEFVRNMASLKIFSVCDTNNIESIEPLKDLTGLKAVAFVGNKTTIVDGDLSYLTKLPNLALLWFGSRKHYSHKLIKQANWDNFDKPDVLLELKW
jgi:protein phosphatase 1 regulatory subunit 7